MPLLLLLTGLLLIYYQQIVDILKKCTVEQFGISQFISQLHEKLKPRKLKKKLKVLTSQKRDNFIVSAYSLMNSVLEKTGEKEKLRFMQIISVLCGLLGGCLALYLKSYLLVPIFGVGFALIPMWLTRFKAYEYNMRMLRELSVVLSMISNTYNFNENIVTAVEENLGYMGESVRDKFATFVKLNKRVNPDVCRNLAVLKDSIDNEIFKLWCDNLIICQKDINQKVCLHSVVEQFTSDMELYNMLSAEITKPMIIFLSIAGLTLCGFPLAGAIQSQMATEIVENVLFHTMFGQLIVTGYAFGVFWGLNLAITLSTSID